MELTDALLGDVPAVVITGAVDESACDALWAALHKWLEARHNIVFLDLTDVTYMDGAGLAVLGDWVQALRSRGWLGIVGPAAGVRARLEEKGLLSHPNVRFFKTRQAARMVTGERQST